MVLENYRDQFDVDMVIATVDTLGRLDINQYAQKLFYNWGIGKKHGGKGILLLVDKETGQSRFEVSYELEHILTDVMCGRIIHNQVRPFWEMDMIYVGMLDAMAFYFLILRVTDGGSLMNRIPGPAKPDQVYFYYRYCGT